MLGYAVGSFALIVLLSALNGFENIIFQTYDAYYPDIKITPVSAKIIDASPEILSKIQKTNGVQYACYYIEENAVVENGESQVVALVKGVKPDYVKIVQTDSLVVAGDTALQDKMGPLSWMSEGMLYRLNVGKSSNVVNVLAPRRESVGVAQMEMMEENIRVSAMIKPGDEMTHKLLIVPYDFAATIFEREGKATGVEVKIKQGFTPDEVMENLEQNLGNTFKIKDRRMQNDAVYKMFNTEKWVAFGIMAFMLLIITFNLVGSLTMLVIEKKQDIELLSNLGMTGTMIKRIFFNQGMLIAIAGCLLGIIPGIITVYLQVQYGFIKTTATFVSAYPVQFRVEDAGLVFVLCTFLGVSGALYPALKSTQ